MFLSEPKNKGVWSSGETTHLHTPARAVCNAGARACLVEQRIWWLLKAGPQNTEKNEGDRPEHGAEHPMQQHSYVGDTRKYQGCRGIICIKPVKILQ